MLLVPTPTGNRAGSAAERSLLIALGATRRALPACLPFATSVEEFAFADGAVFALPPTSSIPSDRSIVAALLLVRDMHATRNILQRHHVAYRIAAGREPKTIWVWPSDAHGVWQGFRL